jgi:hypothetical protein
MHLKVSPKGCHIFERLLGFHVHKVVHDGTALACGFLVEQGRRSQYWNETGLWRNALLVNQKKTDPCRLVCRELHIERSSRNDVTLIL